MTIAIILVVAAILSLVVILGLAVTRGLQLSPTASLAGQIQPIDVEAFRNLVSPDEDNYLRRRLSASQFRQVRRERLRATAAYVQIAGRNAAVLIRIGQSAIAHSDSHTAEAARQLVDQALQLRRNSFFVLIRINLALALPNSGLSTGPVLQAYERLNGSAMLLGRLQNPAAPVRISTT